MLWLADTSVAIAAVSGSHEAHQQVNARVGKRALRLVAHAALETYSVLTRLPGDARLAPGDAAVLIRDRFGTSIPFPAAETETFVDELGRLGVAGGAVYDAVIGATCRACKGTLLTRDRRAVATYEALNVRYELFA